MPSRSIPLEAHEVKSARSSLNLTDWFGIFVLLFGQLITGAMWIEHRFSKIESSVAVNQAQREADLSASAAATSSTSTAIQSLSNEIKGLSGSMHSLDNRLARLEARRKECP